MPSTVERVLGLWREAERDLDEHAGDASMLEQIRSDVEQLRWLYRSVTNDEVGTLRRFAAGDVGILEATADHRTVLLEADPARDVANEGTFATDQERVTIGAAIPAG